MKLRARSVFNLLLLIIAIFDFATLAVSLLSGYWLWVTFPWHGNYQLFEDFSLIVWVVPFLGLFVFHFCGLYKRQMGILGVEEQSLLLKAVWVLYAIVFGFAFFYRDIEFSRLAVFYSVFIALVLLNIERTFLRYWLAKLHKKSIFTQKAIIYGAGYHGQRLERWIHESPQLGIQVVGFLDDNPETLLKKPQDDLVLGGLRDLKRQVNEKNVSLLFIAHPKLDEKRVMEIFHLGREFKIRCWVIPSLYQFYIEKVELQNIGGIPLVGIREESAKAAYEIVKNVLDRIMAGLLLICLSPFLLVLAVLVKTFMGSPVFFFQKRIGKNAAPFEMIKFRTLSNFSDSQSVSPELNTNSGKVPKIPPFANFLRSSGLDELPQLMNVLKGQMSLVGPRPEMPFIVEKYNFIEKERLSVKPGITGLWQTSGDRKKLLIHENMDYDLYYIQNMSFNLDTAILIRTFAVVIRRIFSFLQFADQSEK